MIVLCQKLALTNVLLFINISGGSDQLFRLIAGLLIALLGMALQFITQPFRKGTDNSLSCVVQLGLVLFFTLGIMIKLCDTDDNCSELVGVNSAYEVSVAMICLGLLVLLIPIGMLTRQLLSVRAIPILRDANTMEPPLLLLGENERYHLFLCVSPQFSRPLPLWPHLPFAPSAGGTSGLPARISAPSSSDSSSCSCRALLSSWTYDLALEPWSSD